MNNTAKRLDITPPNSTIESGSVSVRDAIVLCKDGCKEGSRFGVRTDTGMLSATRALSCLAEPEPGDHVLVATVPEQGCFVLAILKRASRAPVDLKTDGDLRVHAPAGRFTIAAQEGVDIVSPATVALTSGALDVKAKTATVVIDALAFLGGAMDAQLEKVSVVASVFERTAERVTDRVKRAYRFVAEVDQLRAEHVDYMAKKNMRLRGQNALVTAEELVKVDGAQVHVG
jgi:hypothetical protein